MRHYTDSQIMAKYQSSPPGIRQEIEGEIYRRHFGLVKVIANGVNIDDVLNEDKAAECFPAFLKAIREYDPEKAASLKSFIKLCVKRKLTDLYRQRNQCSEIPARFLRSLQEIASDGDEMTLEDILGSDEDITLGAEHEADAVDLIESLNGVSFDHLIEAVSKATTAGSPRLISSYRIFAKYLFDAGAISAEDFANVEELVSDWANQGQLFSVGPDRDSVEAQELIDRIHVRYIAVQTVILLEKSEGYLIPEIAVRQEVPASLVSEILAAIAEIRGGVEEPLLRAA